jgi:hypothetical protein
MLIWNFIRLPLKNNHNLKQMKTKRYLNLIAGLLIPAALMIMSCQDEKETVEATISLNESVLTMVLGTSETLTATVTPTGTAVEWSSNNADVVSVNNGVVTATGVGNAIVHATSGRSRSLCEIAVIEEAISVTGVSLDTTDLLIATGDSRILTATVTPSNATYKNVRWSSSNPAVAIVDEYTGEVTGVAIGEAVVTATTREGNRTSSCSVRVWPSIELSRPYDNLFYVLDAADPDGKITFRWTPFQGTTEYVLKMSLTDDFNTAVFSKDVTGNTTDVSYYELNEQLLSSESQSLKLNWTILPKASVNAINSVRKMDVLIDRHEYAGIQTAGAVDATVTGGAGVYEYLIATGSAAPSSVLTTPLTNTRHPDSLVFTFRYKSNKELPALGIYFVSGGADAGSYTTGVLPQSAEWKTVSYVQKSTFTDFSWGASNDYLRLDFGAVADLQLDVTGLHFRGMNDQEIKEYYVPELLKMAGRNQCDVVSASDYEFQIHTTGTDPSITTSRLTVDLPAGAVMLTFEYIANAACTGDFQIFFASDRGGLAEDRSIRRSDLTASSNWKTYSVDISQARTSFLDWGDVGSYMRLDFGNAANYDITVKNIRILYK